MSDTAGRKRSREEEEESERNWPQWVLQSTVEEFQTMFQLYGDEGFLWLFQVLGFRSVLRVIVDCSGIEFHDLAQKLVWLVADKKHIPHHRLHFYPSAVFKLLVQSHHSIWFPLFNQNWDIWQYIVIRNEAGETVFHLYAQSRHPLDYYNENLIKLHELAKSKHWTWILLTNNGNRNAVAEAIYRRTIHFLSVIKEVVHPVACSPTKRTRLTWIYPVEYYLTNDRIILDRYFLCYLIDTFPVFSGNFDYRWVLDPIPMRKWIACTALCSNAKDLRDLNAQIPKQHIFAATTDIGTLADAIRGNLITRGDYSGTPQCNLEEFPTQKNPFHQYMMLWTCMVDYRYNTILNKYQEYAPVCLTPAIQRFYRSTPLHKAFYNALSSASLELCQSMEPTFPTPFVLAGALRHFQGAEHAEFRAWLLRYRRWKPRVDVTDWFPPQFRDEARQLLVLCARNGRVPRDIQRLLVETLADMYIADFDVILSN